MSGAGGSILPLACAVRLLMSEPRTRFGDIGTALELTRAVYWSGIPRGDSGPRSNRLQGDQHQRLFARTDKSSSSSQGWKGTTPSLKPRPVKVSAIPGDRRASPKPLRRVSRIRKDSMRHQHCATPRRDEEQKRRDLSRAKRRGRCDSGSAHAAESKRRHMLVDIWQQRVFQGNGLHYIPHGR